MGRSKKFYAIGAPGLRNPCRGRDSTTLHSLLDREAESRRRGEEGQHYSNNRIGRFVNIQTLG